MKICYVTLGFMPATQLGGPIQNSYNLLKDLVRRGHHVTVCCTNLKNKVDKLFPKTHSSLVEGIEVIYFNTHKLFPVGVGSFGVFIMPEFAAFCRHKFHEFDIIHIDGYRDFPSIVAYLFARKFSIPYVIQARGTLPASFNSIIPKRIFDVLFGRRMLNSSRLLIASSQTEQKQYIDISKNSKINVCNIQNGLPISEYDSLPDMSALKIKYGLQGKVVITYFGRIHKLKGIDHLVRAFSILVRNFDAVLLIGGPDESYKSHLIELIESEGLSDVVMFLGRLDGNDKIELYRGSDIVVYASQSESFGMVAFEAALCETPVIVSRDTGCGDLILQYDAGFTVTYGNYAELADLMITILRNCSEVSLKMKAARQVIRSSLSWDAISSQYERAYISAAGL